MTCVLVYAWKAPELESLNVQSKLRILLAQPAPLNFTRAPSSSLESNRRLQAVTKSQHFSVRSACTEDLEVVHAILRRPLLNFDDGVDYCVPDECYLHA